MGEKAFSVGQRLKAFRKQMSLTQEEFAKELGTTQANVSQIEHGSCMPAGNYISSLISRFPQIDLNWLFYGTGSMLRGTNESEPRKQDYEKQIKDLQQELREVKQDNRTLISVLGKRK